MVLGVVLGMVLGMVLRMVLGMVLGMVSDEDTQNPTHPRAINQDVASRCKVRDGEAIPRRSWR